MVQGTLQRGKGTGRRGQKFKNRSCAGVAPCVRRAKWFTLAVLFATMLAQRHSVVVRCAMLGCLQLHLTFDHLFLHVVVCLMVATSQLGFTMSLSWIPVGAHVFYHCMSMDDQVPAVVLGFSLRPGDFLRIQYKVGGKASAHEAAFPKFTATIQKPSRQQPPKYPQQVTRK